MGLWGKSTFKCRWIKRSLKRKYLERKEGNQERIMYGNQKRHSKERLNLQQVKVKKTKKTTTSIFLNREVK